MEIKSDKTIDFSDIIECNTKLFFSSTPSIIRINSDNYLMLIRYNHFIVSRGSQTINKLLLVDNNFKIINSNMLECDYFKTHLNTKFREGIEDLKLYLFKILNKLIFFCFLRIIIFLNFFFLF